MDELVSSTDALGDIEELSDRLARDGYLYLPGFLARCSTAGVRAAVLDTLRGHGWLAAAEAGGSDDGAGAGPRVQPGLRLTPERLGSVYPAVQRLESFHRFAHQDRILRLVAGLLGGEVFCHPAKACRLGIPSPSEKVYTTRAHQDFVRLHLECDVLTAWLPLTACSGEAQGLRILRYSHLEGFRPTDPAVGGALPLYLPIALDDPRWLTAAYRPGDLVLFHSLTVHAAGPNTSTGIRLSVDFRYQRRGGKLRTEYAHPHGWPNGASWDEICRGWESRRWIELPDDTELVPGPAGTAFGKYLATLIAPGSRILNRRPAN